MSASPYESFASVYQQENHLEATTAFFAALRKYRLLTKSTGHVLELGCGSGILVERIADAGPSVMGIDRSRSMLRLAQRRCRRFGKRVQLRYGDLARMPVVPGGNLAVACFDVVNHLKPAQLRAMMRGAYQNLLPGGHIVFDTLNRFCFETYWDDEVYYLENRRGDLVMECSWQPAVKRGTARMVSYVKTGRDRHLKRESLLHEYLHEDRAVRAALADAGFVDVVGHPWSPWPDQDKEPSLDRTLWIAAKSA